MINKLYLFTFPSFLKPITYISETRNVVCFEEEGREQNTRDLFINNL